MRYDSCECFNYIEPLTVMISVDIEPVMITLDSGTSKGNVKNFTCNVFTISTHFDFRSQAVSRKVTSTGVF